MPEPHPPAHSSAPPSAHPSVHPSVHPPAMVLAAMAVEELAAAGVRHVVLCPGSRSAPLAYRLARPGTGVVLHVRHDERVAAFTALGIGLAGTGAGSGADVGAHRGGPIGAVLTTSGTAVANLHPAVLEAHHANRRLVVVTADRPVTLRGTWANQTSELQAGLFGPAVRARLDLADTDAAKDPDAARALLAQTLTALHGAGGRRPGPVHLNLGFSEPLLPYDDVPDEGWSGARVQHSRFEPPLAEPFGPVLELPAGPRTVLLAGDGAGGAAQLSAQALGLPLLAEPSSGARYGPNAIGPYRLLLESPELGGAVERVLAFGRPTLSRPVTRLLSRPDVEVVLVSPYPGWPDPGRPVTRAGAVTGAPGPAGWLAGWRAAAAAATPALDAVLDADAAAGRLTGPLLAREVAAALRPGETLVAAASNPIRDLDLAAHPFAGSVSADWLPADSVPAGPIPTVLANRGLSGIDGTIATATGVALAAGPTGPHTRLLIGDVAFLHDAGALLADPALPRPNLQVIVLNDDGGGIFSLLEYGERAGRDAAAAAAFERLFGTPHGAGLAAICLGYGVPHRLVRDLGTLRVALATPVPGISVLEVRACRADLRNLHRRLAAAVTQSI